MKPTFFSSCWHTSLELLYNLEQLWFKTSKIWFKTSIDLGDFCCTIMNQDGTVMIINHLIFCFELNALFNLYVCEKQIYKSFLGLCWAMLHNFIREKIYPFLSWIILCNVFFLSVITLKYYTFPDFFQIYLLSIYPYRFKQLLGIIMHHRFFLVVHLIILSSW